jgi:hypothetical protein
LPIASQAAWELRRDRHVDIFAAVGALDADAPVPDVLRAEMDDLTTSGRSLAGEFHDEPLLRSQPPVGAVLRNLFIRPSVVTSS